MIDLDEEKFAFQMRKFEETLKDQTADWTLRLQALQELQEFLTSPQFSGKIRQWFLSHFDGTLKEGLACQLEDRRSILCKEACKTVTVLCQTLKDDFERFSCLMMSTLFKLLIVTIKVISDSGNICCLSVLPYSNSCIELIAKGITNEHPSLRVRCSEYICKILEDNIVNDVDKKLDVIEESVRISLSDNNASVRATARRSFRALEVRWPDRSKILFDTLDSSVQKFLSQSNAVELKNKVSLKDFLRDNRNNKPTKIQNDGISNDNIENRNENDSIEVNHSNNHFIKFNFSDQSELPSKISAYTHCSPYAKDANLNSKEAIEIIDMSAECSKKTLPISDFSHSIEVSQVPTIVSNIDPNANSISKHVPLTEKSVPNLLTKNITPLNKESEANIIMKFNSISRKKVLLPETFRLRTQNEQENEVASSMAEKKADGSQGTKRLQTDSKFCHDKVISKETFSIYSRRGKQCNIQSQSSTKRAKEKEENISIAESRQRTLRQRIDCKDAIQDKENAIVVPVNYTKKSGNVKKPLAEKERKDIPKSCNEKAKRKGKPM